MEKKKILITGASGFIGSFAVEKALELGYETWAGIRSGSSREYLQDARIRFMELAYGDKNKLASQLRLFAAENGKFDCIVHIAGVTKTLHQSDFDRINFEHSKNLADALIETDTIPACFVFMSSLSAFGAGDEKGYAPISPNDTPHPDTLYGKSKLKAEQYLQSLPDFPYIILRPTGVYGPRDKDYLVLMKTVQRGLNVSAGFRKQILTFIHAEDLVRVIFLCIEKGVLRKACFVADGDVYTDTEFNLIVQNALGKKRVLRLPIPLFVIKPMAWVCEKIGGITGKPPTLNTDKYRIMKQRNWNCDVSDLKSDLGFNPRYRLKEGVENTVAWYKKEGWL
ncbi:MAG: NAD(P)-dependent oxidoreductase [Dysgonamonadaceae bacterium]|jgi:nucleoside-diphosphate-sugar epimerase|nr:NAD(P)-dependent oxidoreductase [Dysgonamonadaceae bacterium]